MDTNYSCNDRTSKGQGLKEDKDNEKKNVDMSLNFSSSSQFLSYGLDEINKQNTVSNEDNSDKDNKLSSGTSNNLGNKETKNISNIEKTLKENESKCSAEFDHANKTKLANDPEGEFCLNLFEGKLPTSVSGEENLCDMFSSPDLNSIADIEPLVDVDLLSFDASSMTSNTRSTQMSELCLSQSLESTGTPITTGDSNETSFDTIGKPTKVSHDMWSDNYDSMMSCSENLESAAEPINKSLDFDLLDDTRTHNTETSVGLKPKPSFISNNHKEEIKLKLEMSDDEDCIENSNQQFNNPEKIRNEVIESSTPLTENKDLPQSIDNKYLGQQVGILDNKSDDRSLICQSNSSESIVTKIDKCLNNNGLNGSLVPEQSLHDIPEISLDKKKNSREVIIPITLEYEIEEENSSVPLKNETVIVKEITNDNDESSSIKSFNFDWDIVFRTPNLDSTPPTSFYHVEESLKTGIYEGMELEVLSECTSINTESSSTNWKSYWLAEVISSCGLLIRLRYKGFPHNSNSEFWCDLSSSQKNNLKHIGWAKKNKIVPESPLKLTLEKVVLFDDAVFEGKNCEQIFENMMSLNYLKIKCGILLEVLCGTDLSLSMVVKVIENKGGLILVEPLKCNQSQFRIFYLDERVKCLEWNRKNGCNNYVGGPDMLDSICEEMDEETKENTAIMTSLLGDRKPVVNGSVLVGQCIEMIHPQKLDCIYASTVKKIIDNTFFELLIGTDKFVTSLSECSNLLPINFCKEHELPLDASSLSTNKEFNWDVYMEANSISAIKLDDSSSENSSEELGFDVGQMLEILHPQWGELYPASVDRICGRILQIKIISDEQQQSKVYVSSKSQNLFPVGFASSHGLPLFVPKSFLVAERNVDNLEQDIEKPVEEAGEENMYSMWCERLFINHFCSTGPYLSRTKIAKLPRSLGPGPVSLVLGEILSQTITAGYIPTRVLRELQHMSADKNDPSLKVISLKAKFKRYLLKATVKVPTLVREVDSFLMELSKSLLCCNNLWAFKLSGENCPSKCNGLNYGPTGNVILKGRPVGGKRKRGPKKRLLDPMSKSIDATTVDDGDRPPDDEEDDEDELSGSESASRPCSPMGDALQKKQKRLLTSLEIHMNTKAEDLKGRKKRLEDSSLTPAKKVKTEKVVQSYFFPPAEVSSDPLNWSVSDVEKYVLDQPSICHHAVKLREHEVDGRALMLLNLPTLVHYFYLPHSSAVVLAQHICKVKLAHFVNFPS